MEFPNIPIEPTFSLHLPISSPSLSPSKANGSVYVTYDIGNTAETMWVYGIQLYRDYATVGYVDTFELQSGSSLTSSSWVTVGTFHSNQSTNGTALHSGFLMIRLVIRSISGGTTAKLWWIRLCATGVHLVRLPSLFCLFRFDSFCLIVEKKSFPNLINA